MTVRRGSARLVFRWYKLTSDQKTDAVGGGAAGRLASAAAGHHRRQLQRPGRGDRPKPPETVEAGAAVLLLTAATADRVPVATRPREDAAAGRAVRRPHLPLLLHQPADGRRRHGVRRRPRRTAPPTRPVLRGAVGGRRLFPRPDRPLPGGARREHPNPSSRPSITASAASTSPTAGRRPRRSG